MSGYYAEVPLVLNINLGFEKKLGGTLSSHGPLLGRQTATA